MNQPVQLIGSFAGLIVLIIGASATTVKILIKSEIENILNSKKYITKDICYLKHSNIDSNMDNLKEDIRTLSIDIKDILKILSELNLGAKKND